MRRLHRLIGARDALRKLLPGAFPETDLYTRVLRLTDFVAGMTDHSWCASTAN